MYFPCVWGLVTCYEGDHRVCLYDGASVFHIMSIPEPILLFPHEVIGENLALLVMEGRRVLLVVCSSGGHLMCSVHKVVLCFALRQIVSPP